MAYPVQQPMFSNFIHQASPGNINSAFLCFNEEDHSTFIIHCGMTAVSKSGEEIEQNELRIEEMD